MFRLIKCEEHPLLLGLSRVPKMQVWCTSMLRRLLQLRGDELRSDFVGISWICFLIIGLFLYYWRICLRATFMSECHQFFQFNLLICKGSFTLRCINTRIRRCCDFYYHETPQYAEVHVVQTKKNVPKKQFFSKKNIFCDVSNKWKLDLATESDCTGDFWFLWRDQKLFRTYLLVFHCS